MSSLPELHKSLTKFLHKKVGKESLATAQNMKENETKLTSEALQLYDPDEEYEELVENSPIMMTVLHSSASSQKFRDIGV